ncbi:hypothetical protein KY359_06790 [Candidatus Woesearchaeota archaeon]|nr:hypothetical protein [Candidatus Woesearchaeota archaeon]
MASEIDFTLVFRNLLKIANEGIAVGILFDCEDAVALKESFISGQPLHIDRPEWDTVSELESRVRDHLRRFAAEKGAVFSISYNPRSNYDMVAYFMSPCDANEFIDEGYEMFENTHFIFTTDPNDYALKGYRAA